MEVEDILRAENHIKLQGCFSCDPVCVLSKQVKDKLESENRSKSAKKLGGLIVFCMIFIVVEIVGGVKANSLAVLTDAAHLLTDVFGFSISLFTVWASGWDATPRHSFGFFRLEVLGALFSVQLIWLICGILIYEAIDRIMNRNELVNGKLMFMTAAFGFLINIVMVTWLGHDHSHGHGHGHGHGHHSCGNKDNHYHHHHHGTEDTDGTTREEMTSLVSSHKHEHQSDHIHHENENSEKTTIHEHHQCDTESHQVPNQTVLNWVPLQLEKLKQTHTNMNLQGAYLHVIGDLIQSIGVMIGGALIWAKPNWLIVDLVCTLGFSVLVLVTTISLVRNILGILMESTPSEVDVDKLQADLKRIRGVRDVHDMHVWAMSVEKLLLSCHITAETSVNSKEILHQTRDYIEKAYGIHHVTVQIEQD